MSAVFCYPAAQQSDPENIPDSKAYGMRKEEMRRVMEQMKEKLVVAEAEHAVSAMEDYGAYEAAPDKFLKKL